MGNNLCPQSYLDMVVDFISNRSLPFNSKKIINYCYSQTSEFDNGDKEKIEELVQNCLTKLLDQGILSQSAGYYFIEEDINETNLFLFEEPKIQISQTTVELVEKLDREQNETLYPEHVLKALAAEKHSNDFDEFACFDC